VGKVLNPQPSPAVKNHWKKPKAKLPQKLLKSKATCFLFAQE